MEITLELEKYPWFSSVVTSLILVILVLTSRYALLKGIRNIRSADNEFKRMWIVQINNISTLLILLGLFFIWAAKIQSFALSIVAIAAAIVIATKELLSCILGGLLKFSTSMFKIGDRIEVAGVRGDVINNSFFSTTLMEVGPGNLTHQYTGKRVLIPNSYFLVHHLVNDTRTDKFRLHTFKIRIPRDVEVLVNHNRLLEISKNICGHYEVDAKKYLKQVEKFEGIEAPSTEPRVHISLQDHTFAELVIRVPVPALKAAQVEQQIIKQWLTAASAEKTKEPPRKDSRT